MANSIALFKTYVDLLDEVYQEESLTSVLDMNSSTVQAGANANEIIIPKMSMDGLADYSRSSGYVDGDVTLTNETVTYNYDRGRRFTIDAMDNQESAGVAFGQLSSEFVRTQSTPEQDAFRFATYAGLSGISKATAAALTTGEAVLTALVAAQNAMDEDEVPSANRYLFITPSLYNLTTSVDTTTSKEVLTAFARIIKVPQKRFYTAIDLKDGKDHSSETGGADETIGGFAKATAGKNINFMIIHKPAVLQLNKHLVNKVVSPDDNQTSDGWLFFYRSYALADAYENKRSGLYLHPSTT